MFVVNYRNTHPISSHITFSCSTSIYVEISAVPDIVPGIGYRTAEAQRSRVRGLEEYMHALVVELDP